MPQKCDVRLVVEVVVVQRINKEITNIMNRRETVPAAAKTKSNCFETTNEKVEVNR